MPLSRPAARALRHMRDIELRGYEREDGLIDIEAHMTDRKTYTFPNQDRGIIASGEALHDMWLRVTIDRAMTITACEAAMDLTPHAICPGAAPNFARLAGLTIGKGFLKAAMARVGGVQGCTHLRELLQQIGTVAFQTNLGMSMRARRDSERHGGIDPALRNTCFAYDENGPLAAHAQAAEN